MEATARAGRMPQLAKYEVLEEIGHGGMATVYRARDRRLAREVAIKVIHPHLRDSHEVVSRFNAEARAVAKLRHPNIVEVFDVSEADEPEQYLVVELIGGTTLRKVLQAHGALIPEIAAAIALELLGALGHASANGVVHRDVKPENVLLDHRPSLDVDSERATPSGTGDRAVVKLTDFGIAKLLDAQGVTSTGQVLGSPAHMAPEQIEGGDVDSRADIFSLGVLLYECMVGHLPFEGNNPAQVLRRVLDGQYGEAQAERPVVGKVWSGIVDRALAHAVEDRFASPDEMRAAIVVELDRLGFRTPRQELEAWLDDPVGYAERHTARMLQELCARAAEARKAGDVLAAASDYNRALAYAPQDPRLLRIVVGMNRAEARGRFVRRAFAALGVAVVLGGVAFGVGRLVQARDRGTIPVPASATALAVLAPDPAASASESSVSSVVPSATVKHVVVPVASHDAAAKPVERSLTLDLVPSMGVTVSVDGAAPYAVATGDVLKLDGKTHALAFACAVCTPVSREVAAGDKDDTLRVAVPIKPVLLVIDGDVNKTYQIVEHPELPVRAGTNTIALKSRFEHVTVKQMETQTTHAVRLEAGKSAYATF